MTHDVLVRGFRGEYKFIVSVETLLKYPEKFHMDAADVQREVETARCYAAFVEPEESITSVEDDPDDDKFLEAAVAGTVDYIVSGDRHLLDLESFRGIEIVDPRTFYEILSAD